MEQTLLLIKPNVIQAKKIGAVISELEEKGISIRNMKMETLTKERAEGFYEIHRGKPFFDQLIRFMTSGPIVEMILEHDFCVEYVRDIIGHTDPQKAKGGTIRNLFGCTVTENAVHASDSTETANREIQYIFGNEKEL
ncbi:MAG TPA: nucleoside-diphosphate kinase [Anaerolineae bacterium]|nr:nucleoside-diphosphate kinase [Anaerolineae bacterium]